MTSRCAQRRRRCPQPAPPPRPARLWATAAQQATDALRAWLSAPVAERASAYFAYRVALEHEDDAAAELAAGSAS